MFVLIVAALVLVLSFLDLEPDALNLRRSSVTLPLDVGVLPQQFLDDQVGLLQLNP